MLQQPKINSNKNHKISYNCLNFHTNAKGGIMEDQKQEREFIGVKEACELLGYKTYITLRKHIERGAIKGFKSPINGHYYVSRKHIEEILQGKFN